MLGGRLAPVRAALLKGPEGAARQARLALQDRRPPGANASSGQHPDLRLKFRKGPHNPTRALMTY